jgi:hypothetical protein
MTAPSVTILYEDQRVPRRGFGLHALVTACVFDLVDGERYLVEGRLRKYRALKGVSNVLKMCREDFELLAADGGYVIAVIDGDAIRREIKLPPSASRTDVERTIKKGCPTPDRLFIAVLERNTESVLEAAAACDPSQDAARMDRAVRHKDVLARDAILTELARERARAQRDCILGKMPSLKALVDVLASMLLPGKPSAKAATPQASPPARKPRKPRR